ncbi:hypothetical protein L6164_036377 [Bauhinia variegata]|uniref:Uncharacterized protein n=1 Tax=Bauhinia variegata TaxID=167791 RepID=A0ACB9KGU7_BAUVA|nr:hypothetical protein L6164_036377 [Bauhinia variegata]
MVKKDTSWPRPQHVAWQLPNLNGTSTLLEPRSQGFPAYQNTSTCNFPAHSASPGLTVPAFPSARTEQTDEALGFLQYPNSELCVKEIYAGNAMQNSNPASLQKKFLIFDHSGNKTRMFYSPVLPRFQSPFDATPNFTQGYDINEERVAINRGQNIPTKYLLPEESDENRTGNEESDMHEDTEEINALLYSDDDGDDGDSDDYIDDDEVTSTARSPLANKRTHEMLERPKYIDEEVASSDQPNKRQKLVDRGYKRAVSVDSASSIRRNETFECTSDAESKYSSGQTYSAGKSQEGNPVVGDIQLKKDKIRELLRVLENIIPGAKGKQPLLVIDGTIDYLKILMSQIGTVGVRYH